MQADEWEPLAAATTGMAVSMAPLPPHSVILTGNRERWFTELGYTFWNLELLDALASRCAALPVRRWVELAAGTGRLSVELARRGLSIVATDSYAQTEDRVRSFQRVIRYGEWVGRMDAREAIARLQPDAVLCAWPPLGSALIPDLLSGHIPGSGTLRSLVAIGEPGGASEMPVSAGELPTGWGLEEWPECEPLLVGFNDPPGGPEFRSHSALRVYLRR